MLLTLWKPDSYSLILIITVYRSPCADYRVFCEKIAFVLDFIHNANYKLIICGDLNIDPIRGADEYFCVSQLLATYNAINMVNSPTRGTNILDHCYSSIQGCNCTVRSNFISDHSTILLRSN